MGKNLHEIRLKNQIIYNTNNNTFDDFPVGRKVKVITPCEDFSFFYGETGEIIKNSGRYLSIIVKFDKPRHFENGHIQTDFNFNPKSLCILNEKTREIAKQEKRKIEEKKEKALIKEAEAKRSERFEIMDL